jgi:hypothetical protein
MKTLTAILTICALLCGVFVPPVNADGIVLPPVGQRLVLSTAFMPVMLKGVVVDPKDPFKFNFIVDSGDTGLKTDQLNEQGMKLVKYFLAALAVPEDDMWVNLSPYEKDRIIAKSFGDTEMGRDLLAQDYILKQLSASLTYPEEALGKKFWDEVYKQAQDKFGSVNIPMNTFNKVWIMPAKAQVYERSNGAFVVESRLKVMLEEDYMAKTKNVGADLRVRPNTAAQQIIRDIILPKLEQEVNEGAHFTALRQAYHAMILASWYKIRLKESIIGKQYVNQGKTNGVAVEDKAANQKIYEQYLQAFKKGVYNYIKDVPDTPGHSIPKKYFSGGMTLMNLNELVEGSLKNQSPAMLGYVVQSRGALSSILVNAAMTTGTSKPITKVPLIQLSRTFKDNIHVLYQQYAAFMKQSRVPVSVQGFLDYLKDVRNINVESLKETDFRAYLSDLINPMVSFFRRKTVLTDGISPFKDVPLEELRLYLEQEVKLHDPMGFSMINLKAQHMARENNGLINIQALAASLDTMYYGDQNARNEYEQTFLNEVQRLVTGQQPNNEWEAVDEEWNMRVPEVNPSPAFIRDVKLWIADYLSAPINLATTNSFEDFKAHLSTDINIAEEMQEDFLKHISDVLRVMRVHFKKKYATSSRSNIVIIPKAISIYLEEFSEYLRAVVFNDDIGAYHVLYTEGRNLAGGLMGSIDLDQLSKAVQKAYLASDAWRNYETKVKDFVEKEIMQDQAMKAPIQKTSSLNGGIDLNARNMDLQIKRDANGFVLPVSKQNLDQIRIDGLFPVILSILPVSNMSEYLK